MMKRMFSGLLALVLLLGSVPVTALALEEVPVVLEEEPAAILPAETEAAAMMLPEPPEVAVNGSAMAAAVEEPVEQIRSFTTVVSETVGMAADTLPFSAQEYAVQLLTNRERLKNGLQPLMCFAALQSAADIREEEIAVYFNHTRPDGSDCFSVVDEKGIAWNLLGENIAGGYPTPADVVAAWMDSEGHRENILTADFDYIGTGYYNSYWVQLFLGNYSDSLTGATVHYPLYAMKGTNFDDLTIFAAVESSVYGTCYLPITVEYATGFDPNVLGPQKVSLKFLGFSGSITITLIDKLSQPQVKLTSNAATGKPKISWEPILGAKEYRVYWATTAVGTYSLLTTTSNTTVTHTAATVGTRYYYVVKAIFENETGNSDNSEVKSIVCDLPRPTGLKVVNDAATGKNTLTWNKVTGAEKYQIWYSTTGKTGSYNLLYTTKNLTHTHKNAQAGTLYYYKVKAVHSNTAANSAFSASYQRTCDLAKPTGLKVTNDAATGKNVITWSAVPGADKYQVWSSETGKDGSFKFLVTTKNLTHTHKGGEAGQKYYYKVKAIHTNTNANSALSGSYQRTCDLARPVVTIGNNASTGKVRLTWEAVAGAEKYQVWFSETGKTGTFKLTWTCKNLYFNHNGSKAGVTGYYKVKAIHSNANANSAFSAVVKGAAK